MAEPTILTPIELTDAELDEVSGGLQNQHNSNKTHQYQRQSIKQTGGSLYIGGGSGGTAINGSVYFTETLTATQTATETNTTYQTNTISGTNVNATGSGAGG